jgi:xylulokinase
VATDCLIGIDIGTTVLKAVLVDAAGARLASFAQPYPLHRPAPGFAEQSPADWMDALFAALAAFSAEHDLSGLAAIGLTSQVNTHVFVDAKGEPLLPAIVWQDTRAAEDAAVLETRVSAEQKIGWFGAPIPIDASHQVSRMAYVRRVHPEIYAQTRHVLLPKDFCALQLTGAVAADPVAAIGLVDKTFAYVDELIALLPDARQKMPPLFPFNHVAGRVRDGLPGAGTPVVIGAMDAWAGMFGVGVVRDGQAMYQSGTSEILGIVSARVTPTPGVIVFPPYEGITLHAAPTQSGGAAFAWFAAVLGKSPAEAAALVGTTPPSDAIPMFLPHLQGERAPLWDAASRGVFARLDPRAGAAEMTRGVMEGVAFSARLALEAAAASAGVTLTVANIGGGGARSDVWCQIRADAMGVALRRAAVPDSAALGAAVLAGLGSGLMPSLADAVGTVVRFDRSFEPETAHRAYYDDRFEHYRALYASLSPFNDRF